MHTMATTPCALPVAGDFSTAKKHSYMLLGLLCSVLLVSTVIVLHTEDCKQAWRSAIKPWEDWHWQQIESYKQTLPKYQLPDSLKVLGTESTAKQLPSNQPSVTNQLQSKQSASIPSASKVAQQQTQLPVWVITIPRLTDRIAGVQHCFNSHNTSFEFVFGIDGQKPLPQPFSYLYAGDQRRHSVESENMHQTYMLSNLLSHIQVYYKMIAEQKEIAVVFEDDGCISSNDWTSQVIDAIQKLPNDWEILYLNAFNIEYGGFVGEGIRVLHKAAGTMCYVMNQRFALKLIEYAQHTDKNIDKVLFHLSSHHQLQAYITDPPLCTRQDVESTLHYDADKPGTLASGH